MALAYGLILLGLGCENFNFEDPKFGVQDGCLGMSKARLEEAGQTSHRNWDLTGSWIYSSLGL